MSYEEKDGCCPVCKSHLDVDIKYDGEAGIPRVIRTRVIKCSQRGCPYIRTEEIPPDQPTFTGIEAVQ